MTWFMIKVNLTVPRSASDRPENTEDVVLSSWSLWAGGQPQMDHYGRMDAASSSLYQGYRFPVEIISHWCVQQRGLVDHVSG
jgi:hypothetical protein